MQRIFAAVAVKSRAVVTYVRIVVLFWTKERLRSKIYDLGERKIGLTVLNIQGDGAADDERNDLDGISDRLQLGRHGCRETLNSHTSV